jgi:hypothetical protein
MEIARVSIVGLQHINKVIPGNVMDWICMSHQNLYIEVLTGKVSVFGDGTLRK